MLFTEASLRTSARAEYRDHKAIIKEAQKRANAATEFDIFLSHAFLDRELIAGLVLQIEELGHSVYVDWIYDSNLERIKVNRQTAETLRLRMTRSRCLFYATTQHASTSDWMPWECGFQDGLKQKVAICPVSKTCTEDFEGQEYLSLYPYVQKAASKNGDEALWIHESPDNYVRFSSWLEGKVPAVR